MPDGYPLRVGPAGCIGSGEALVVETEPPIAVFCTDDGQLFAIDDTCTHQEASLAEGWLEGCAVECPLHGSSFDLRTGVPNELPATQPVRTHRVWESDGFIWVAPSLDETQQ